MSSILVVCTGNICRSPVGEAVLKSLLPSEIEVSSAGTHAVVGRPVAPQSLEYVKRKLGIELDHVAQQLMKQQAEASDLIITMTAEHRAWVARTAPRAVRRTFTLREIEQITAQLPQEGSPHSLREVAMTASTLRARVPNRTDDMDIADPYGRTPEEYEQSFQQVLGASSRLAAALKALTAAP